ncbi:MAG TPA: response regulator transcription factor [Candidatus Limnocylindrales bacterium]|jgi:DNA-binding NarL/FixJ family response regulator|nr:response regulator transcription factor [Candidatus Limnocylindrales bacterium]
MTDSAAVPGPLRVLLADPDDRVRESLAGLLRIGQRCLVVGSAATADEALHLVAEAAPDILVVDPRLAGTDGATAFIARVREVAPTTRILVLDWSDTADHLSGADAYVRKTFRPHELIDAVISTVRRSVA